MEKTPEDQNPESQEKEDVFLLGGKDLEMYQMKKRLSRAGETFIDKGLEWGAEIGDYENEIRKILREGKTPIAVELAGAEDVAGVVDIDHHAGKAERPAAIAQVMERIGRPLSFIDQLVAANDSAYIPGMEKKFEEFRPVLEERYGVEKFEKLKARLISLIRAKDRQMQGVTKEEEDSADEAISNKEVTSSGTVVVRVTHDKFSPVADRLYPTWPEGEQNLIVVCNVGKGTQKVYYFGRGDVCKAVKEHFSGWGGGIGYGKAEGLGFGGCETNDPNSVIDFITAKYQGSE